MIPPSEWSLYRFYDKLFQICFCCYLLNIYEKNVNIYEKYEYARKLALQ